jgi:hypothetical protein
MWKKFFFSRKFVSASLSVGMIFLGGLVCVFAKPFQDIYSTYVTGVVSIFTAYSGANVVAGLVSKKVSPKNEE